MWHVYWIWNKLLEKRYVNNSNVFSNIIWWFSTSDYAQLLKRHLNTKTNVYCKILSNENKNILNRSKSRNWIHVLFVWLFYYLIHISNLRILGILHRIDQGWIIKSQYHNAHKNIYYSKNGVINIYINSHGVNNYELKPIIEFVFH